MWVIQIISLISSIIADNTIDLEKDERKIIESKRDVLHFFIPYFWVIPMLRMISNWWNNLK